MWDIDPSFDIGMMAEPYSPTYQPPLFKKFDGTRSTREHVITFLENLGINRGDKDSRLKEFSKLLTGKTFIWYTKLRSNSIHT